MFFAPMFRPEAEIDIYGPAAPAAMDAPLRERLARYISAPLTPIEIRELPSHMSFREAEPTEWRIGPATIRAASVTHRGPTLGYRVTEGDRSVVYIPDHEPGLGTPLDALEDEWISGLDLACDADAALPRRPVHGRRVPAPPRVGALLDRGHADVRPSCGGQAGRAVSSRPAPFRRRPRRHRGGRRPALDRARRAPATASCSRRRRSSSCSPARAPSLRAPYRIPDSCDRS